MSKTKIIDRLIIVFLNIYHFMLIVCTIIFFPIFVIAYILFDFDIRDYNNKIQNKL